jgi:plastocyanin
MGKATAWAKSDSSIMNLKSLRRKTMYRKTIITTIMLLVAAIALSAAAFANAQECCKAQPDCCKAELECCKTKQDCCRAQPECCKAKQECCKAKQPGAAPEAAADATLQNGVQTATVEVTGNGFEPSSLKLKAGAPAKVTFVRKSDETCAKEVVIKEYGINRKLPLNEPVTVEFTPRKGEFSFACGMDMLKGKLVVE